MCLEILIFLHSDQGSNTGARKLFRETGLHVRKIIRGDKQAFHISTDGQCSCGFIGNDFDMESSVLTLKPDCLEVLADTVSIIASESETFSMLIQFHGSDIEQSRQIIDKKEMILLIRKNRVGNNVMYDVK